MIGQVDRLHASALGQGLWLQKDALGDVIVGGLRSCVETTQLVGNQGLLEAADVEIRHLTLQHVLPECERSGRLLGAFLMVS